MAIRDVILWIAPQARRESMIAESKAWIATCATCGTAKSIWDRGGLRWKAMGDKVISTACPNCGMIRRHNLRRADE